MRHSTIIGSGLLLCLACASAQAQQSDTQVKVDGSEIRIRDASGATVVGETLAAGIHTGGVEFSAQWLEAGFQMVTLTSDANCMTRMASAMLAEVRGKAGLETVASGSGAAY